MILLICPKYSNDGMKKHGGLCNKEQEAES